METLTLRRSRARRTRELASWQLGSIGIIVLSVLVNMGMMARIASLEQARNADAERYRTAVERAERSRDLAVRELGEMSIRQAKERTGREELAEAYETIGAYQYIGECTVTTYCPCEECCGRWADGMTATGLPAGPGIVAVDPEVIPLGSTVIIDGQRYLAADTGVTGRHVDICLADHSSTVEAGVRSAKVWVVEP